MPVETLLIITGCAVAGFLLVTNVLTPHAATVPPWHAVLGVPEDAAPHEIDAAYIALLARHAADPALPPDRAASAAAHRRSIEAAYRARPR